MTSNGYGQRWAGRVALVTGASSGIGRATANALARHGMTVIGCARNIKPIQEDSQTLSALRSVTGTLHAIRCDMSREQEILSMFAEIRDKYGGLDVCICNAGFSHSGTMSEPMGILNGDTEKWRAMIDVNLLAVAICCREAVKQMTEKGTDDGQLLVTNGNCGHQLASTGLHFYCVTKHALTVLVESVKRELKEKKSHIRIAQISPGRVESKFRETMFPIDDPEKAKKVYKDYKALQTTDIAEYMVFILQAPPHVEFSDILLQPTGAGM